MNVLAPVFMHINIISLNHDMAALNNIFRKRRKGREEYG